LPQKKLAPNKGKSPRKSLAKYSSKSSGKYGKLSAPPRCNLSASLSSGLSLEEIYARRSLHSRSLPCVYHVNDQHVFKKLMLKSGMSKLELDYETKLFLNMFSSTPSKNLVWGEGAGSEGGNHILTSQISRTRPPFVHWNGGVAEADVPWIHGFRAHDMLEHLRERSHARHVRLSGFLELVRFVEPSLREVGNLSWGGVCGPYL
tara:strand:- start:346 stop:957 length:612 start_codon:yes stop_codon:yes gene_type:complete